MKSKLILGISLVANAALVAGYLAWRPAPTPPPAPSAEPTTPATTTTRLEPRAIRASAVLVTNGLNWANLESGDYREYIQNLRAIGCPEETIRDIIIADLNKLYGKRIAALYPSPTDFKFWQTEGRNRAAGRDREEKIRDLEREKRQVVKELLGVDLEQEMARRSGRPDEEEIQYGFLSPEKQTALRTLRDKYRNLEREIFSAGGGFNPDNRAKFLELRSQREAELAQILNPQELEELQLRTSRTAQVMRQSLTSFEPTENEFREVFKIRQTFEDQFFRFGREGGGDEANRDAAREQRRQAEQQMNEQIAAALGPQRFAQYQMAQDDRFRENYEWAQRANLPRETAEALYQVQRTAEEQRQQILRNEGLPQDQRAALLAAVAEETKRTLSSSLGPQFEDYQRRSGEWIGRLTRTGEGGGGFREQGGGPPGRRGEGGRRFGR